jgi:hypothetical protein
MPYPGFQDPRETSRLPLPFQDLPQIVIPLEITTAPPRRNQFF